MKNLFIVFFFILALAFLMPAQGFVDVELPLTELATVVMIVTGAYLGFDQFASFVASRKMAVGEKYQGSYKKLLMMTVAMMALATEAIALQYFNNDVVLPMGTLVQGAGLTAALFVGGNKALNAAEQEGPEGV